MKTDTINSKKNWELIETPSSYKIMESRNSKNLGLLQFDVLSKMDCGTTGSKENAELIIKAIRNYDSLLSTLKKVEKYCEESGLKNCDTSNLQHMAIYNSLHLAKAAIKQAEEL